MSGVHEGRSYMAVEPDIPVGLFVLRRFNCSRRSKITQSTRRGRGFYNEQRPHSSFGLTHLKTPMEFGRQAVPLAINQ